MTNDELVDRLRAMREAAGLSQADLANAMTAAGHAVARSRIGNYERKVRDVPIELIEPWAAACGRRFVLEFEDPAAGAVRDQLTPLLSELDRGQRESVILVGRLLPRLPAVVREVMTEHLALWARRYLD